MMNGKKGVCCGHLHIFFGIYVAWRWYWVLSFALLDEAFFSNAIIKGMELSQNIILDSRARSIL